MKLVKHTVEDFVRVLASDAPAPGGGSTAALTGAMGVALTHMVGALTVDKKNYAEHSAFVGELMHKAKQIKNEFLLAIDRDTEAFNSVSAVFAMPKETDADKQARKLAMQEALKTCTRAPYDIMSYALAALEVTEQAIGRTNTNAASDLGVAALNLKAALQGAWLNILINIGGISDSEFVAEYRQRGQTLLTKGSAIADSVYQQIVEQLHS